MKKIYLLTFSIVLSTISNSFAERQILKSKINDGGEYSILDIDVAGDKVTFSRTIFQNNDGNIKQRTYNISDIEISDHKFTITEEQKGKYWFIPFNNTTTISFKPNNYFTDCVGHSYCTAGECGWQADGTCDCGSDASNPCHVVICDDPVNFRIVGPGVIVKGTEIVEKFSLIGGYKDEEDKPATMKLEFEYNYSDTDSVLRVRRIPSTYTSDVGERIYNKSNYPTKIEDGKFLTLNSEVDSYLWCISFDPTIPPYNAREIVYYYECCGNCNPGECDWRAAAGCRECKCPDQSASHCTTTRHIMRGNGIQKSGGGVIYIAKNVLIVE